MPLELLPVVMVLGAVLQFVDSSIGMGFGTLTPLLILLGHDPLHVVSAVLFASAVLSTFVGVLYQYFHNMDVRDHETFRTAAVFAAFGIVGIVGGAAIAINLPERLLRLYIGTVIAVMGVLIMVVHAKTPSLSGRRLVFLGSLASFNKGITGGGFGPVLAGGQLISGMDSRVVVGVTALTEGIVSAVGVATFLVLGTGFHLDWPLTLSLLAGGAVASPLASYTVRFIKPVLLKTIIALGSILMGAIILIHAI